MSCFKTVFLCFQFVIFSCLLGFAQDPNIVTPLPNSTPVPAPVSAPASVATAPAVLSSNDIIDKIIEREHFFMAQMRHLHPLVETYIQNLKPEDGRVIPTSDQYFLGRIDMSNGAEDRVFHGPVRLRTPLHFQAHQHVRHEVPAAGLRPDGGAGRQTSSAKYYDFSFVRREFLGEVRCLVIDVQPEKDAPTGRFVGRIWVEDQDYNIVRFNGTYGPCPAQQLLPALR